MNRFGDIKPIRIMQDQDGTLMIWQNPKVTNVTHLAIPMEWFTEQMIQEFENIRAARVSYFNEEKDEP